MLRFVALAVLGCLIFLVLRATLSAFVAGFRGGSRPSQPRQALRDDLVKDPVCETYIPRRKAVARTSAGTTRYFCSAGCADRFAS